MSELPNKLTLEHIHNTIAETHYHVFPGTTLTVCALVLKNGFTVTGTSACIDPTNFNEAIGRQVSQDDAIRKIWDLEGYLLKQNHSNLPL